MVLMEQEGEEYQRLGNSNTSLAAFGKKIEFNSGLHNHTFGDTFWPIISGNERLRQRTRHEDPEIEEK